jgi:hypothetical protein
MRSPSTRPNPDEGDLGLRGGLDGDGGAHDGARPPARAREAGRRAEERVVRGGAPHRHHLRPAREGTSRREEWEERGGRGRDVQRRGVVGWGLGFLSDLVELLVMASAGMRVRG